MMAIPLVYFSILAFYLFNKRRKIDLAIYILLIYAISGFIGYLIEDTFSVLKIYHISLVASISYCALHTICILPILLFSNIEIKSISKVKNEKLLKYLAWGAFFWFIFYMTVTFPAVKEILSGDLREIRNALYRGDAQSSSILHLPAILRMLLISLNYVYGCSWILIFLAFYSLLIQKLQLKFFILYMVASLSGPWSGILNVDRSNFAMYLLAFGGVAIFFWPYMNKVMKYKMSIFSMILSGVLVAYLAIVSFARFGGDTGDDTASVNESVFFYMGQSFPYFCYYFDTFDNPAKMSNLLFPFTNKFLFGDDVLGGFMINQYLHGITGRDFGVFYTYLGQIQITAGHLATFIFCIVLFVWAYNVLGTRNVRSVSPTYALSYVFFASFSFLGLFSHYYQLPTRTFSVLLFFILISKMGVRLSVTNLCKEKISRQE